MNQNAVVSPDTFSAGSVISRTFSIFFANLGPCALVIFLTTLPEIILEMLGLHKGGSTIIGLFFKVIAEAVVIGMVYQHLRGRKPNISSAFSPALGRTLSLLGIRLFTGLAILGIVFVATIALMAVAASRSTTIIILAGIPIILLAAVGTVLLTTRWAIAVPACIIEEIPALASMGRSRDLTEGKRGALLLIVSFLWVIAILFIMAFTFVGAIFAGLMGATETFATIVGSFAGGLFALFFWIAGGIIYYDLRAIKEGVDLEHLTEIFD